MHDMIHTDPFLSTMVPIRVNRKEHHSRCHEFYENKKSKCKHLSDGVQKNCDSKIVQMNVLDLQLHSL